MRASDFVFVGLLGFAIQETRAQPTDDGSDVQFEYSTRWGCGFTFTGNVGGALKEWYLDNADRLKYELTTNVEAADYPFFWVVAGRGEWERELSGKSKTLAHFGKQVRLFSVYVEYSGTAWTVNVCKYVNERQRRVGSCHTAYVDEWKNPVGEVIPMTLETFYKRYGKTRYAREKKFMASEETAGPAETEEEKKTKPRHFSRFVRWHENVGQASSEEVVPPPPP